MCKSREQGGQRCASHSRARVAATKKRFAANPTPENATAYRAALVDYASTTEGSEYLSGIANSRLDDGRTSAADDLHNILAEGTTLRLRNAAYAKSRARQSHPIGHHPDDRTPGSLGPGDYLIHEKAWVTQVLGTTHEANSNGWVKVQLRDEAGNERTQTFDGGVMVTTDKQFQSGYRATEKRSRDAAVKALADYYRVTEHRTPEPAELREQVKALTAAASRVKSVTPDRSLRGQMETSMQVANAGWNPDPERVKAAAAALRRATSQLPIHTRLPKFD